MALTALHHFGPEDLNPGEQIIYRARLNFVSFLLSSKTWIVLILVGFFILGGAYSYRETIGFLIDGGVTLGVFILAGGFLLYGGYKFSVRLIDWLYDEDIITNQRVIDYNQEFLFSKELSTANMKAIEDVVLVQSGIFRTLFNYGTLDVRTSASAVRSAGGRLDQFLLLEDISRPKNVQRLIDEVSNRAKREVTVDPEEVLIIAGLIEGDLEGYFVIKKTRGWKARMKKLLNWE